MRGTFLDRALAAPIKSSATPLSASLIYKCPSTANVAETLAETQLSKPILFTHRSFQKPSASFSRESLNGMGRVWLWPGNFISGALLCGGQVWVLYLTHVWEGEPFESSSTPGSKMVDPQNHVKKCKKAAAPIFGRDSPLPICIYPGFEAVAHLSSGH